LLEPLATTGGQSVSVLPPTFSGRFGIRCSESRDWSDALPETVFQKNTSVMQLRS
jgi:hypothetical protein